MKITIRTNPEIIIDVEPIEDPKTIEPTIALPQPKVAPDVKPEPERQIKGRAKGLGTARNAARKDTDQIIARRTAAAQ